MSLTDRAHRLFHANFARCFPCWSCLTRLRRLNRRRERERARRRLRDELSRWPVDWGAAHA